MNKKIISTLLLCFMMTGHIFGAASARTCEASETNIFQDLWCRMKYGKSADQIQQELFYFCYLNQVDSTTHHADQLERLLQNGGQQLINCKAKEYHFHNHYFHRGCTLLMCAIIHGQTLIAQTLLRYGADVSIRPGTGVSHLYKNSTALALAVSLDKPDRAMVRLLLEHGANPNQVIYTWGYFQEQTSPLLISCNYYFRNHKKEHASIIDLLVEHGADRKTLATYVNDAHCGGDPAPILISYFEQIEAMRTLLRWGAHPDACDTKGNTALHFCCLGRRFLGSCDFDSPDRVESVHLLLQHGARPDIKNNDGYTALDCAVYYKKEKSVALLRREGNFGQEESVLIEQRQTKLDQALRLAMPASPNLLYPQEERTIENLLKHGADPTKENGPFSVALRRAYLFYLEDRREKGSLFDSHYGNKSGKASPWKKIIDLMLNHEKAAPFLKSYIYEHEIIDALKGYDVSHIENLVRWGGNLHSRNDKPSRTALHFATAKEIIPTPAQLHKKKAAIVTFVLKQNVPADMRDYNGNTPLHLAAGNKNVDIVRVLLKHLKPKQEPQAAIKVIEEQHNG